MLQHPLQYTATRTAPYCNTLQQHSKSWRDCRYNTLQHSPHHTVTLTASHCNTHCNTHCNNTSDLGAILGREILTKCHFEGYILKRRLYIHMMRERERERDRARERERERTREKERERERKGARKRALGTKLVQVFIFKYADSGKRNMSANIIPLGRNSGGGHPHV